jgi:hypothetical protein
MNPVSRACQEAYSRKKEVCSVTLTVRSTFVAGLLLAWAVAPLSGQQPVNPRAAVMQEFQTRVKQYLDTRAKAVSHFEPLKQDADQATIAAREKALGEAIRTARAGAKPGDLFGGTVGDLFRAATKADFQRRSTPQKKLRLDELPHFRPVVNQTYPSTWPLQTFPPSLIADLPKLPPELEYRFVDNSLILRDTKANLVVDYLLDVM